MKNSLLQIGIAATIAVALSSCGPSALVVRSRPVAPAYARPLSPGRGYVWIDGDWFLRGNQYYYKQGYWATPSRRHSTWITGHWKNRRGGSYWVPGHWR